MAISADAPAIEKVKDYVIQFMTDHFTDNICYHNIDHTLEVVAACELIGRQTGISQSDMNKLIIAAWLHDIGYHAGFIDHEARSAEMARDYLTFIGFDASDIEIIANCILSTKIPQQPITILEWIICDADLFHLASEKFFEKSDLLWREFSFYDKNITKEQWIINSKKFVESHQYWTEYGKTILTPKLEENINKMASKGYNR